MNKNDASRVISRHTWRIFSKNLGTKIKSAGEKGTREYTYSSTIIIISSSGVIEARIVSFLRAAEPKEKSIPSPIERQR